MHVCLLCAFAPANRHNKANCRICFQNDSAATVDGNVLIKLSEEKLHLTKK